MARAVASDGEPLFSYPIGWPDRPLGDGFIVRHGYATENAWYHPGWWHTAEDWYAIEGETAGAGVYAMAAGEVVFAGSDYPGRVVIVHHGDDLYSIYGHLDPALAVEPGDAVEHGQLLGAVHRRTDGRAPSHLHFEVRTFLTTDEVNGSSPRYGYGCGVDCPPGPGYWPMDAPEHPSALGWRNSTHVIARRAFPDAPDAIAAEVVVATHPTAATIPLWSAPAYLAGAQRIGELRLRPGDRYGLLEVRAGPEGSRLTSAEAYRLWYRIELEGDGEAWVEAAVPSDLETGTDGWPSSIRFNLLPLTVAKGTEAARRQGGEGIEV
jgi:murein DD-endopeptidase MepM/ murein hydrolase activator NlpD